MPVYMAQSASCPVRILPLIDLSIYGVDNAVASPTDDSVVIVIQCFRNLTAIFPMRPNAYNPFIFFLSIFDFPIYVFTIFGFGRDIDY